MSNALVIDDEALVRSTVSGMLESLGYTAMVAPDGRRALELFRSLPIALVVTDIFMPEKDGLETIRELRRLNGQLPVIAMSGKVARGAADFLKIARRLGASQIIPKPFTLEDLRGVLAAC